METLDTEVVDSPLAGLRVLEISQGLIVQLAGQQLARLGTHILAVRDPEDWVQELPPLSSAGDSAVARALSVGKEVLSVRTRDEARLLVTELAPTVDVLLIDRSTDDPLVDQDCLHAGSLEALGVVVGEVTSPAGTARSELTMQAANGMHRHLGDPSGRRADDVVRPGFDVISASVAACTVAGVVAAVYARADSQLGQTVSVTPAAVAAAMLSWNLSAEYQPDEWSGVPLDSYGLAPRHGIATTDGHVQIDFRGDSAHEDAFLISLGLADACLLAGKQGPFLRRDRQVLAGLVASAAARLSSGEVCSMVKDCGGTAQPVLSVSEAMHRARNSGIYGEGDAPTALLSPWRYFRNAQTADAEKAAVKAYA